ncbi:helix-turn-helix domain-containing protein [Bacillus tianshenii]|uniref:phBC6A51 family helix-turn-helix protein n=1 Tax=Sutcliffiella tianshenii TaxID=1463404 RepID=UPI001CD2CD82|nr:phBC6A51 family helix-turn-helix protein [Bacillus tianshenii]MCA1319768.1 helix-turn-helix domain-containing protein [Bacillus tianshenii]
MTRPKKKPSKQPSQVPPLDDRHYLAIHLLFKGYKRQDVAKECGISRMQLYRWEQREDFNREYDKLSSEYARQTCRQLKSRTSWADMALKGDLKATMTILNAHGIW